MKLGAKSWDLAEDEDYRDGASFVTLKPAHAAEAEILEAMAMQAERIGQARAQEPGADGRV